MGETRATEDPRYPGLELQSVWNGVPRIVERLPDDQFGASSLASGAAGQPAKGSRGVNTNATRGAVR